jgi:hypothetical protein
LATKVNKLRLEVARATVAGLGAGFGAAAGLGAGLGEAALGAGGLAGAGLGAALTATGLGVAVTTTGLGVTATGLGGANTSGLAGLMLLGIGKIRLEGNSIGFATASGLVGSEAGRGALTGTLEAAGWLAGVGVATGFGAVTTSAAGGVGWTLLGTGWGCGLLPTGNKPSGLGSGKLGDSTVPSSD